MTYIITNSGNLSYSFARPFIDDEGMWHTYDGRGYTCKMGDIVWDFNTPAAGKMILAVQSPYERFEYKMYVAGECKYFEATAGTGDSEDKDAQWSRLTEPPTNHPDPMMFNANWQGDNGGFISWVSNENNTGVSNATTVLIKSNFYDLGKPILAAALIDEFIIAIHCKDGKAEFCEYEIKDDGTVSERFQEDLKLEKTESKQPELDRLAKKVKDLEDMPKSTLKGGEINPKTNLPTPSLDAFIQASDKAYLDQIKTNKYCTNWQRNYKEKMFKRYISTITKSITNDYIVCNYRASFDKSITKGLFSKEENYESMGDFLVHVGYKITKNILFLNKELLSPESSNGFALFNLRIKWTNQEEIEKAIEDGITPIPKKQFSYSISHKKTKYFDPCQMTFYRGCEENSNVGNNYYVATDKNRNAHQGLDGDSDGVHLYTDSYYQKSVKTVTERKTVVIRSDFESDNAFIFAEMANGVPTWISAEIDSKISIGFTFDDLFSIGHQLNWKEAV